MEQKKNCSSCKKTKLTLQEKIMIFVGLYVFATSIYGTIQLIKNFF